MAELTAQQEAKLEAMDAKVPEHEAFLAIITEAHPEAAANFGAWMRNAIADIGLKRAGRLIRGL